MESHVYELHQVALTNLPLSLPHSICIEIIA